MSDERSTPTLRRALQVHPLLRASTAVSDDPYASPKASTQQPSRRGPLLRASRSRLALGVHVGPPSDNSREATPDDV